MPPSPEQIPVPAFSAPKASATLADADKAPKLISETKRGISNISGFLARGPITVLVPTASSSNKGTL